MKKFFLSLFCVFFVPVTVLVFRAFDPLDPDPHFNPRFWISGLIYLSIILYCFSFLLKNRPSVKSIILSLLVGGITLGYGLPLDYPPQFIVCLLAGIASVLCFLQIVSPEWHTEKFFVWKQNDWKVNFFVITGITVFYLALVLIGSRALSLSIPTLFSALAAGVSEELIFHVFIPVLIYTRLKTADTLANRFWVFLIIHIPFSLLHFDYYGSLDFAKVMPFLWSCFFNSAIFIFLEKKYGILYGIYAHFICDFFAMNILLP